MYVAPGDYYFFNCFGKFVENYACELKPNAIDWCTELSLTLPQTYSSYDHIDYHFVNICGRENEILDPVKYNIISPGETIENYDNKLYKEWCGGTDST